MMINEGVYTLKQHFTFLPLVLVAFLSSTIYANCDIEKYLSLLVYRQSGISFGVNGLGKLYSTCHILKSQAPLFSDCSNPGYMEIMSHRAETNSRRINKM